MATLGTGAGILNLLFQINSIRRIIFDFGGQDVSTWTFQLFIRKYKGARSNVISLTNSNGLSFVTYNTDQLRASFSSSQTNIEEGEYYWELRSTNLDQPLLCGDAYFSYDAADSDESDSVVISINRTNLTVTVSNE